MNDYAVKEQPVRINGFVWCDDDDDDGDGNGDGEGGSGMVDDRWVGEDGTTKKSTGRSTPKPDRRAPRSGGKYD